MKFQLLLILEYKLIFNFNYVNKKNQKTISTFVNKCQLFEAQESLYQQDECMYGHKAYDKNTSGEQGLMQYLERAITIE